jgi:hypothetical protein
MSWVIAVAQVPPPRVYIPCPPRTRDLFPFSSSSSKLLLSCLLLTSQQHITKSSLLPASPGLGLQRHHQTVRHLPRPHHLHTTSPYHITLLYHITPPLQHHPHTTPPSSTTYTLLYYHTPLLHPSSTNLQPPLPTPSSAYTLLCHITLLYHITLTCHSHQSSLCC